MRIIIYFILFIFTNTFTHGEVTTEPDALLLRYPDVSSNAVVFVYAGDIWKAPLEGGIATRLSSPPGIEMFPKFSPDGSTIAFSANYEGNVDVYKISASGGVPERLTHHPDDDLVVDWHPDGKKVLYRSEMMSHVRRYNKLFLQPADGGLPQPLPFYYGELATFDQTGSRIAFQYSSRQLDYWKRYAGGMAGDIWIYDFIERQYKKFTDYIGTDAVPMWHKNKLYFLSDRGKDNKLNIWQYSLETGEFSQITSFSEYDVKWPSIGPGHIVFENAGRLYLLELDENVIKEVKIGIPFDAPDLRPEFKDLSDYIENFDISPDGSTALLEARGEIITVNSGSSYSRNLSSSSGIAERFPAWSPDNGNIAYFSDKTGEYNLFISPVDAPGNYRRLTDHTDGYYINPVWSPDSGHIAYADQAGNLYALNISDKKNEIVDTDSRKIISDYSWSPDSRWIAYSKTDSDNVSSLYIHNIENGNTEKVTTGYYNDQLPVFSSDGKYLYFYSDRSFEPVYSDFQPSWVYPNATRIHVLYLRKDIPFIDSVKREDVFATSTDDEKDKGEESRITADITVIDFNGIQERISIPDIDSGNFGRMEAEGKGIYYLRFPHAGLPDSKNKKGDLFYYDIADSHNKLILSSIDDFRISDDGSKIIYKTGNAIGIVDSKSESSNTEGRFQPESLMFRIDPVKEWKQIFNEAWRIERDFFYDPNMHGTDWKKMKERYSYLLPHLTSRHDLNYVIGEMIGELSSSHTYVGGGDMQEEKKVSTGMLGCDFAYDGDVNAYAVSRIYEGGKISPHLRSPLTEKGVKEGDLILEVNGRDIDTEKDPWASFQGLANQIVSLTIGKSGNKEKREEMHLKLLNRNADLALRYYDWVDSNREYVEEETNGKVGYVYVPDTGIRGQNELVKQFVSQSTKKALIIDERFNSGGQIPDRFIELLDRPVISYWARRYFSDWKTPELSHAGHKIMIVNQWSGSGGDAFPYYFRKRGLGSLVGTRTMGALIGITDVPELVDGGFVTAPGYAFWNTESEWEIEGSGVKPDFRVEITPLDMVKGVDTQLDKAIEVILDHLENSPVGSVVRPPYPANKN